MKPLAAILALCALVVAVLVLFIFGTAALALVEGIL